jgi:pimeloyl-ACP methyl ester carboxylesterase
MTLHVDEFGPGNTPSVMLVHGVATSGWMWRTIAESLAGTLHVLVPDLPGHGRSNTRPWVSMADTVSAIADVIRSRCPQGRAHVVGLSLGGNIALQLAADAPAVVDSAIVSGVNVLPYPNPTLMRLAGLIMAPFVTAGPMLRATAKGLRVPAEELTDFRAAAKAMAPGTFRRVGAELMTFGIPTSAGRSPCRLLAVAGHNEHDLILRSLPELAKRFRHAEQRVAPGVGHGWSGEAPQLFTAMVRAHIAVDPLPEELALSRS